LSRVSLAAIMSPPLVRDENRAAFAGVERILLNSQEDRV